MTKLMPFQVEGVRQIHKFGGRALLADDTGLGKTIMVLAWAYANPDVYPVIVVCEAIAKNNWKREIMKHSKCRVFVLEGEKPNAYLLKSKPKMIVINYEILQYWAKDLRKLKPKLVVLDEIDRAKNPMTITAKSCTYLCKGVPHVIGTSANPMENGRPIELWTALSITRPDIWKSFRSFAKKYCKPRKYRGRWTYTGAENLDILHRKIKKHLLIRRTKKVLPGLPKMTRDIRVIKLKEHKEYAEEERKFKRWLQLQVAGGNMRRGKLKKDAKLRAMNEMLHMKIKAAVLKLPQVIQQIDKEMEGNNEKVIICAIHKKIISKLRKHYGDSCVVLDGSTPKTQRQVNIDKFTKSNRVRVMIAQVRAGGRSWNGQAGSILCTVELDYKPTSHTQFEGRGWRHGQKKDVKSIWFVAKGTIEERILKMNQDKQKANDAVIDGGASSDFNVFDKLIQQYAGMDE